MEYMAIQWLNSIQPTDALMELDVVSNHEDWEILCEIFCVNTLHQRFR